MELAGHYISFAKQEQQKTKNDCLKPCKRRHCLGRVGQCVIEAAFRRHLLQHAVGNHVSMASTNLVTHTGVPKCPLRNSYIAVHAFPVIADTGLVIKAQTRSDSFLCATSLYQTKWICPVKQGAFGGAASL